RPSHPPWEGSSSRIWDGETLRTLYVKIAANCLHVTKIRRDNIGQTIGESPTGSGYFQLGDILGDAKPGSLNAGHITLDTATLLGCCTPGVPIEVPIEYGYYCSGYPPY